MDKDEIARYINEFISEKGLYTNFVSWMEEKGYSESEVDDATDLIES